MESKVDALERVEEELTQGQIDLLNYLFKQGGNGIAAGTTETVEIYEAHRFTKADKEDLIRRGLWTVKDGRVVHPYYATQEVTPEGREMSTEEINQLLKELQRYNPLQWQALIINIKLANTQGIMLPSKAIDDLIAAGRRLNLNYSYFDIATNEAKIIQEALKL